jgi:hypothetical protein
MGSAAAPLGESPRPLVQRFGALTIFTTQLCDSVNPANPAQPGVRFSLPGV